MRAPNDCPGPYRNYLTWKNFSEGYIIFLM